MFKRTEYKIFFSIMISVVLIFIMTLGVIVLSSYLEFWKKQENLLSLYVSSYKLGSEELNKKEKELLYYNKTPIPDEGEKGENIPEPREKPDSVENEDVPTDSRDYSLSTFYSVAFSGENVLEVNTGDEKLYTEDELIKIAENVLKGKKSFGRWKNLAYLIEERDNYKIVAFMDNTLTDRGMRTMLRYILITGGPAILLIFVVSAFLSRSIVKPLEENDRKQRQFISDAGHELKTPVAVIRANGELLTKELGENIWLENILYENNRMMDLVEELLTLSRAESSAGTIKQKLNFSKLAMGEILAFESLAFEKGKSIDSNVEEGIIFWGNKSQLSRLVSILLDNAISYSTGEKIELNVNKRKNKINIQVINEGDAIKPEELSHIFDRFFRMDKARAGDEHHYGLGLAIAKAVTVNHGGNIEFICQDGKITVKVSIPVKK